MDKRDLPFVLALIVALCLLCVLLLVPAYLSVEHAKIKAERDKEVTIIEQQQKTERTEERSQFWQKLVPWGKDEDEAGSSSN